MRSGFALATTLMLALTACAGKAVRTDPVERTMRIGGDAYVISQVTASTWSATAAGSASELALGAASRMTLLAEIERLSGCKVTNSDYSQQTRQLNAQIGCEGQLKN